MSDDVPLDSDPPVYPSPDEPVLTPLERLKALLVSMKASAFHNAPISPHHISEIEAIISASE